MSSRGLYSFGASSIQRLQGCHPQLIAILNEAIKVVDFSVICGHRTEREQKKAVGSKRSKVNWPDSKHNYLPSRAVDIAPYPVDWNDTTRFAHLIGIVRGIALSQGANIRCGCDWDQDGDITDHKFMDWPHIELVD